MRATLVLAGGNLAPGAYTPTEAEAGLVAWARLQFDNRTALELKCIIEKRQRKFCLTLPVDEERIRQEAARRGVLMPAR